MVLTSQSNKDDSQVLLGIQFLEENIFSTFNFVDRKLELVFSTVSPAARVMVLSNDSTLIASYLHNYVYIKQMLSELTWGSSNPLCVDLKHPSAIFDVSWRPAVLDNNSLLTCCADGVYRIWKQQRHPQGNLKFYLQSVIDPYEWVAEYPATSSVQSAVTLQWMNINSLLPAFDNVPIYAADRADKQKSNHEELLEFQHDVLFQIRKGDDGSMYCVFWGLKGCNLSKKASFDQPNLCAICYTTDAISAEHVDAFKRIAYPFRASMIETARAPHLFPLTEQRYITYDDNNNVFKIFSIDPICFQPSNTEQPNFRCIYSFTPVPAGAKRLYRSPDNDFILCKHADGSLELWNRTGNDFWFINSFESVSHVCWLDEKMFCIAIGDNLSIIDRQDCRVHSEKQLDSPIIAMCSYGNTLSMIITTGNGDTNLLQLEYKENRGFIITHEFPLQSGEAALDIISGVDKIMSLVLKNSIELIHVKDEQVVSIRSEPICRHDQFRKVITVQDIFVIVYEASIEVLGMNFRQTISLDRSLVDVCSIEIAGSSFLAVTHTNHVVIYSQTIRGFDIDFKFTAVFEIYVGRSISCIEWLQNGKLVVISTGQFHIIDNWHDEMRTFTIEKSPVSPSPYRLMGLTVTLPDYHPFNIFHDWLWGKYDRVSQSLHHVYQCLRCLENSGSKSMECLPGLALSDIYKESRDVNSGVPTMDTFAIFDLTSTSSHFMQEDSHDEETDCLTSTQCEYLSEYFSQKRLPALSSHEQMLLVGLINSVAALGPKRPGLDDDALRYMLPFKMKTYLSKSFDLQISSKDFVWAILSETQDAMLRVMLEFSNGKLYWQQFSNFGIPFWLKNDVEFRNNIEIVARNEFMFNDSKDPVRCGILYLAMKKKRIWEGLWKIAQGHPDQSVMKKFLANDFTTEKSKMAAAKNAFALLGKQRFDMACCFFLLAEQLDDALSVCVKQLNDLPLAFTVARLYYQDNENLLSKVYEKLLKYFSNDAWSQILVSLMRKDYPEALRLGRRCSGDPVQALCCHSIELKLKNLGRPVEASVSDNSLWVDVARNYSTIGSPVNALDILRMKNINDEKLNIHILQKLCVRTLYFKCFYFINLKLCRKSSYLSKQKELADGDFETVTRMLTVDMQRIHLVSNDFAHKLNLPEYLLASDIQALGKYLDVETEILGRKLLTISKECASHLHKDFFIHFLPLVREYFTRKKRLEKNEIRLVFSVISQFCFICWKTGDLQRLALIMDSSSLLKKISIEGFVEDISDFIGYLVDGPETPSGIDSMQKFDDFERVHHHEEASMASKLLNVAVLEGMLDIVFETILLCLKQHNLHSDNIQNFLYAYVSQEMYSQCDEWDRRFKASPPPRYNGDYLNLLGDQNERNLWNILLHNEIFILSESSHRFKVLKEGLSRPDSELALHGTASQNQIHRSQLTKIIQKLQGTKSKSATSLSIVFQL